MDNNNVTPSNGLGLGIAGLVLGIVALPLAIFACTSVSGLILAILGVALSAVGYSQAKKASAPTGLIMAALVVSIIATSFALLRLTNSLMKLKNIPWEAIGSKIEKHVDSDTAEFERIFKEEFEKELGGNMEDVLKELEGELDELDTQMNNLENETKHITNEVSAYKLGRASGKALRKFLDELNDSTEVDTIRN